MHIQGLNKVLRFESGNTTKIKPTVANCWNNRVHAIKVIHQITMADAVSNKNRIKVLLIGARQGHFLVITKTVA
jgi:hypothetical protein